MVAGKAGHGDTLKLLLDYRFKFGLTNEEYQVRGLLSRAGALEEDHTEEK